MAAHLTQGPTMQKPVGIGAAHNTPATLHFDRHIAMHTTSHTKAHSIAQAVGFASQEPQLITAGLLTSYKR